MDLDSLITLVESIIAGVDGITEATQKPPIVADAEDFPFATVYAKEGDLYQESADHGRDFHTVMVDIHQSNEVIPQALTAAKIWPSRVKAAFVADATILANNGHVVWPIHYENAPMQWTKDVTHYVSHFEVTIKVNTT